MGSGLIPIMRRNPDPKAVAQTVRLLKAGRLVVLPTETQYALAADATSPVAVAAVRHLKGRESKPFSVFLPGRESLDRWRIRVPRYAESLIARFWPGPLTLILRTAEPSFRHLGSRGHTVGVRVSSEPVIAAIVGRIAGPVIATSANPSGESLTTRAENAWLRRHAATGEIVWVRPPVYRRRAASTILDCTGSAPILLRAGVIPEKIWRRAL